jgi:hypothetical protein
MLTQITLKDLMLYILSNNIDWDTDICVMVGNNVEDATKVVLSMNRDRITIS